MLDEKFVSENFLENFDCKEVKSVPGGCRAVVTKQKRTDW